MDDIISVARTLFSGVWDMLLNTDFPGTDISLAALSVAVIIIAFSIRIFNFISGFGASGSTYGQAADALEKGKSAYDRTHKRKIGF